jgi:imidazolonepropionase-like amidohydrolase
MTRRYGIVVLFVLAASVWPRAVGSGRDEFVSVHAPQVVLAHVDVIDGSGASIERDQTVVIAGNQISAVGPAASTAVPPNAKRLELRGHTVIPGLVGMHDHLFYAADGGRRYVSEAESFARLYLASGVTTIRTAGSIDPVDAAIKRRIADGREAGPRIYWSGPYLDGNQNASQWTAAIDRMAGDGATSLKVYTGVGRADLAAIIAAGHRHRLVVTGHLCAVGFREAAALGIDNLEHGPIVDSDLNPGKKPDRCPEWGQTVHEFARTDPDGTVIRTLIRELVDHHVAITSTLAVFDSFTSDGAFENPQLQRFLAGPALDAYRSGVRARAARGDELKIWDAALANEMAFERRFVEAGGLLAAGADPTGWGATLAGLADQRNVELLAKAGFTPEQVVRIATSNGASLLRSPAVSGLVQPGKAADLVVLDDDFTADVRAIRNVRYVFVDGIGFSPDALLTSEYGRIGGEVPGTWRDQKWIMAVGTIIVLVLGVAVYDRRRARQKREQRSIVRRR